MQKSVQIIEVKNGKVHSKSAGDIVKNIVKMLHEHFDEDDTLMMCDAIGSSITPDLDDDNWTDNTLEDY